MTALKNTIVLLRFPFSIYLLPVFLCAISQGNELDISRACLVFFILHFVIYPSSNGYYSYIDQDTDSIGGLENPPPAPRMLFYASLVMDFIGVLLSIIFINFHFGIMVLGYVIASRTYSGRTLRLKKYPIVSFLVVF